MIFDRMPHHIFVSVFEYVERENPAGEQHCSQREYRDLGQQLDAIRRHNAIIHRTSLGSLESLKSLGSLESLPPLLLRRQERKRRRARKSRLLTVPDACA